MMEKKLLETQINAKYDVNTAALYINKYLTSLSNDYIYEYPADIITQELELIDGLNADNDYAIDIKTNGFEENTWQIKLFKYNDRVSLSRGLPIIENFGFKLLEENSYKFHILENEMIHICDFRVEIPTSFNDFANNNELLSNLKNGIVAVLQRKVENDKLNSLLIKCNLSYNQVMLLRSISKYLIQTSIPYSYNYIVECLIRYSNITRNIFQLFEFKFDPDSFNNNAYKQLLDETVSLFNQIKSLDDDLIFKSMVSIIDAMLRTNYYQLNVNDKFKYISFKLESKKILNLPKPFPLCEIFVYGVRFEAIHLRGGKVARGGLRWSDRNEDFRTEVLGLVKAQIVKNSIIVPTGSKGGFICKKITQNMSADRVQAEGVFCYQNFIRALLEITDNLIKGAVVKPSKVICYDGDDPYLVVAADKGTATFSDYANAISNEFNFWLGDAFASGGSVGYDHKKMGITSRGAWESVKRNFRHLGKDIQTEEFSVVAVGDMMGDVFGNAMLLSTKTNLVAAFNHIHIFLDPTPNCTTSYAERKRIFDLARSSWDDYDRSKISIGGGVFLRSDKSIAISPEVQLALNIIENELAPNELINRILKANVDLFFNGGIGTYVKASYQSHEEVKDKASNSYRVSATELNAKVVGEGGNLGLTQQARIEFSSLGGLVYADAIDNSGGVDTSDHEVNIKILFSAVMEQTNLSIDERNKILASMQDEVGKLVIEDNYRQTQVLKVAHHRARFTLPQHQIFMQKLEKLGDLDRVVEVLPTDDKISELMNTNNGLTIPELSVLMSYSKNYLKKEIINSKLMETDGFDSLLLSYFPEILQKNYSDFIKTHYLRNEIIANQLANLIINRQGMTFISRFKDEFNTSVETLILAWWVSYNLLQVDQLYAQIEELDNKVLAETQVIMCIGIERAVDRFTRWVLRNIDLTKGPVAIIGKYTKYISELKENLETFVSADSHTDVKHEQNYLLSLGVPNSLAVLFSRISNLPQLMDVAIIAINQGLNSKHTALAYFDFGVSLQIDWLRKNVMALPRDNKWQALARSALISDVYNLYRTILLQALEIDNITPVISWINANKASVEKVNAMISELQSYKALDLAMLSAAIREFGNIIE